MSSSDSEAPQFLWPKGAFLKWKNDTPPGLKRYDVVNYISVWVPVTIPAYLYHAASVAHAVTPQLLTGVIASPFVCLLATLGILGEKKKESVDAKQKKDYGAGVNYAYDQWRDSGGLMQGALARTYRHIETQFTSNGDQTRESAIEQFLHMIAVTIREVFGEATCGKQICVSLAMLQDDGKNLKTVKFQIELPNRTPGTLIPLGKQKAGAAAAVETGQAQYVADTQAKKYKGQFSGRPYRSFMSWPIKTGDNRTVLGVVSIDSQLPNGFDTEGRRILRGQVEWMCQPALQGIAICLLRPPT